MFAFTDPETRFSLPLLFPFLSLSLSLFLSSPIAYTHEPVLAEASLVKVTTSSGGESESRFRDKRWPPIKLYQRGGPILMAVTADTRPSVYSRGLFYCVLSLLYFLPCSTPAKVEVASAIQQPISSSSSSLPASISPSRSACNSSSLPPLLFPSDLQFAERAWNNNRMRKNS